MATLDPTSRPILRPQASSNLESHTSSLEKWRETSASYSDKNSLGLTSEDWKLILGGAKRLIAKQGTVIVSQNSNFQRIFQIIRGTCRIERVSDFYLVPLFFLF